eukprot:3660105-Pyramimonas_sp.AAC.1
MVARWWTRMRDVELTRPSQAPLFCLLGANATVGTVQSSHVGPVGANIIPVRPYLGVGAPRKAAL